MRHLWFEAQAKTSPISYIAEGLQKKKRKKKEENIKVYPTSTQWHSTVFWSHESFLLGGHAMGIHVLQEDISMSYEGACLMKGHVLWEGMS